METIKGYKGFNKDMTCRGFQYKEGQEYDTNTAEVCESGFHFCEHPLDVLRYYPPATSIYHEVEGSGNMNKGNGKIACTHIKIGARMDIAGLVKAAISYVKSRCTNEHNAEPGRPATAGYRGAATAGYFGAATAGEGGAATAGDCGAATAGDYGAATAGYYGAATAGEGGAVTAGDYGAAAAGYRGAATAGYRGAATAGDCGAATAGDYGAATAGDYGAATAGEGGAATAGYRGAATAGEGGAATAGYRGAATAGYFGAATAGEGGAATSRGSAIVGENGIACVRGNDCRAKGGMGALLIIAEEYEGSYAVRDWKAVVVDGITIKADTWYRLNGKGELQEEQDNEQGHDKDNV